MPYITSGLFLTLGLFWVSPGFALRLFPATEAFLFPRYKADPQPEQGPFGLPVSELLRAT
jgi:hypothetical protein